MGEEIKITTKTGEKLAKKEAIRGSGNGTMMRLFEGKGAKWKKRGIYGRGADGSRNMKREVNISRNRRRIPVRKANLRGGKIQMNLQKRSGRDQKREGSRSKSKGGKGLTWRNTDPRKIYSGIKR